MSAITPLVTAAVFFICACLYLCLLIVAFCVVAALARKARLRIRAARKARIPDYGPPLNADDQYAFAAIERGWKDSAAEPEYDVEEDL